MKCARWIPGFGVWVASDRRRAARIGCVRWSRPIAVLVAVMPAVWGLAVSWDNGGGDSLWSNGANWNPDLLGAPTATDDIDINANSSPTSRVLINTPSTCATLEFGYSSGSYQGYLDIQDDLTVVGKFSSYLGSMDVVHSAGDVVCNSLSFGERETPLSKYVLSGSGTLTVSTTATLSTGYNGSTVEFYQQAGTVSVAGQFRIGDSTAGTTSSALYDMSGGSLSVPSGIIVAWKSDGNHFRQSGGTATFASCSIANDTNDKGEGMLTLQDAADFSASSMTIGGGVLGGTAVVVLDGSRTGAGTDAAVSGSLVLKAGSTLKAVIDDAAVADDGAMRKLAVGGNVTISADALLLPVFDPAATPPTTPMTWTLLSCGGTLSDAGVVLDPSTDGDVWSFAVTPTSLTVTYTPPAPLCTLILLQ